jgi:hypothetical protein
VEAAVLHPVQKAIYEMDIGGKVEFGKRSLVVRVCCP